MPDRTPDWKSLIDDAMKAVGGGSGAPVIETRIDHDMIEAQLHDVVDPVARRDTAAAYINAMSSNELASLPYRARHKLTSAMVHAPADDDTSRAARKHMHRSHMLEPDFLAWDQAREAVFHKRLNADGVIQEAMEDWHKLDMPARNAVLQRMLAFHAEAWGVTRPELHYFQRPRDPDSNTVKRGVYRGVHATVSLNTHEDAGFNDFRTVFDVLVHEATHHVQKELIRRHQRGQIPTSDPTFNQAGMFAMLFDRGYVQPEDDHATYSAQLLERHAVQRGMNASKLLTRAYMDRPIFGFLRKPAATPKATP